MTDFDHLMQAARAGDARACTQLARCYDVGAGVEQDRERAGELYQQAAQAGDPEAMCALAYRYDRGIAEEAVNPQRALALYTRAAELGSPMACAILGNKYECGRAVPQDFQQAAKYYRQGADAGYCVAQYFLARLIDRERVQGSLEQMLTLYQAAAEQNHPGALLALGFKADEGKGCERNPQLALSYYERAADLGYAPAQYLVALSYQDGRLREPDGEKSRTWLTAAAEQGYVPAIQALAA